MAGPRLSEKIKQRINGTTCLLCAEKVIALVTAGFQPAGFGVGGHGLI